MGKICSFTIARKYFFRYNYLLIQENRESISKRHYLHKDKRSPLKRSYCSMTSFHKSAGMGLAERSQYLVYGNTRRPRHSKIYFRIGNNVERKKRR